MLNIMLIIKLIRLTINVWLKSKIVSDISYLNCPECKCQLKNVVLWPLKM